VPEEGVDEPQPTLPVAPTPGPAKGKKGEADFLADDDEE
jgi:hypothetical protein